MSIRERHLLAVTATCTVLAAMPGCGSDEPDGEGLPQDAVAQLETRLDEVQRRYDDALANDNPGACDDIERNSYEVIRDIVAALPDDVDRDVVKALEESLARLRELTRRGCADVEAPEPEVLPDPVPEDTVPEEPTPDEEETEPEDTAPDDEDDRSGDERSDTPPGRDRVPPGLDDGPPSPGGGAPAPDSDDDD